MACRLVSLCAVALPLLTLSATVRAELVSLELILAVDSSVSVSDAEFDLQIGGLARALRSETVLRAIRAAGSGGVAIAVYHWGNINQQRLTVAWTRIRDRRSAHALAARIAGTPRAYVGGATAIHSALDYAIPLFDDNRFEGRRRVIDISADGRNNTGISLTAARDRAVAQGITVNGLAILNDVPFLDDYFAANVIGGADAFVEPATSYQDFARAIERKLAREINGPVS